MGTQTSVAWHMKGMVLQSCNCDYGCPCNFNAMPTHGHCEGGWTWHIEAGRYGDTPLDGLNFSVAADWPAAIYMGNGVGLLLIDERASAEQRAAIQTLLSGQVGGPWAIIANTLSSVSGPHFVPYEVTVNGAHSSFNAGDKMILEMEPIRNPVTKAEAYPQVVLPQGFIYKESTRTSSRIFRVNDGIRYEYSGTDATFAPFEYTYP